jgi:hypothetical protein
MYAPGSVIVLFAELSEGMEKSWSSSEDNALFDQQPLPLYILNSVAHLIE